MNTGPVLVFAVPPASLCFKSSVGRSDRLLQFAPTNLHSQRMQVTGPDSAGTSGLDIGDVHVCSSSSFAPQLLRLPSGVWYEVITFGAPADHHQAFRHGGLRRLLGKHASRTDG